MKSYLQVGVLSLWNTFEWSQSQEQIAMKKDST